ncbi:hypothetical protein JDFR1000234_27 [uncultured archaeal virus]|jgi:hypothetical protein|uniref:Uncharacterized protein n=1 Tax=uncultured archaeal virus TaxID=1960247 RepID=A0A1S5Y343_9VIRU|nr:hypothetical protein JDFR1000234_27 [uncultured archaeal virus]
MRKIKFTKRRKQNSKSILNRIFLEVEKFKKSMQKTVSWDMIKKDKNKFFVDLSNNNPNLNFVVSAPTLIELYAKLRKLGYKVV